MRVNPDRARRYQRRTLAKPPKSIRLTQADMDDAHRYQQDWERGRDQGPIPAAWEWHGAVTRYCQAKGLGQPSIMVTEHSDGGQTLQWAVRGNG